MTDHTSQRCMICGGKMLGGAVCGIKKRLWRHPLYVVRMDKREGAGRMNVDFGERVNIPMGTRVWDCERCGITHWPEREAPGA